MKEIPRETHRLPRWYFGGCASAMAACATHPLDLLKVHLQTAKSTKEFNIFKRTSRIIEVQGFLALYNGLTASLFRQLTYSTARFGLYEILKQSITDDPSRLPFHQKVFFAGISGAVGGFLVSIDELEYSSNLYPLNSSNPASHNPNSNWVGHSWRCSQCSDAKRHQIA